MAVFGRQLSISAERPAQPLAELQNAGGGQPAGGAINLDNILKLIPGDVVSIYVTGKAVLGTVAAPAAGAPPLPFIQANWLSICFWTCLAVCVVFRIVASKPVGQTGLLAGVNWSLVVVTAIAFFIWAHAVGDTPPVIPGFTGGFAGFFAMIFGVLAPKFVTAA